MGAERSIRRLRDLLDVDSATLDDGEAIVWDAASGKFIGGTAGGGGSADAVDIDVTPAGGIAATNVQDALEELDSEKASATSFADHSTRHENGGADEISVAGLSGLLADTQTPAAHVHDGGDLTTGTVADARIAATIARDAEVTAAVSAEATARDSAITTAIANLIASAPGALDTLNELAAAFGNDPNFATTITNALAGKQPIDSDLTAVAGLSTTAYGRALLELANAAALRTAAGLVIGTDVQAQDSDLAAIAALTTTSYGRSLLEAANAGALRTLAGTVIGTDVEAHDADLTTIAGLSPSNDDVLQRKAGAWTNRSIAQLLADLGIAGAPDPVADIFGTPDTAFEFSSSSLTGLTSVGGTPDAEDAHTTIPGHYYVRDDGAAWIGRYASVSAPFTAIALLSDSLHSAVDGRKAGLFVSDSSPAMSSDTTVILVGNGSRAVWVEVAATSNLFSSAAGYVKHGGYLAIRANSTTDVDFLYSENGRIWHKCIDSRNPSLTVASVGLAIAPNSGIHAAAFDFLRIWNSAKSFPGALA